MFGSLRYRLIASYVAVIFLCLFLAGSAFVLLLREYQQRIRMDQLADLSFPISFNVRGFETAGASPEQISQIVRQLSDSLGVRIILADRTGLVLEDTAGMLDGITSSLPSRGGVERRADSFRPYYAVDDGGLLMVAPSIRIPGQGGRAASSSPAAALLPLRRQLRLLDQLVADAPDRLDPGRAAAELVAQPGHVHVDGAGVAEIVVAPGELE